MSKFQVLIETISQELVEIEGNSIIEAEELVAEGQGEVVEAYTFDPIIIESFEIENVIQRPAEDSTEFNLSGINWQ